MGKEFIGVIVPLSILLPLVVALIRWKKLTAGARYIFLYLFASATINAIALFVGRHLHWNNMPLVHILTAVEVAVFLFYYDAILNSKRHSKGYIILGISFVMLCIINAVYFQSIFTYSSYTRSVEAIILILFVMNYFAGLAAGVSKNGKISAQPDFYFNVGILLYFSGAFMLFIFSNFVISTLSKANFFIIWNIHGLLLLLMYIFFSLGFIVCKK